MTITMIKISDLILSEEVQSRVSLDENVINEYAEAMKNGDEFPPIDVYKDGEDNYVADGFHRVKGAIKAALTEIKAKIKEGTIRDAILHSVSANSTHGLRRTNLDKRNSVEKLLVDPEWQLWSDNQIAKQCAVSHSTVAKVRQDLSCQLGKIQERNFERNGKTHTMNTAYIGEKREDSPIPTTLEPDDSDKALPISEVLGSNVIKAPVEFKKPPEVSDDDEDLDETDDLNIETDDPGMITVKPVNWKEKGNKFVEAMITASAFEKALEIDANGGFPDNMKEIFAEAILLMQRNLPRYLEYFMTTNSIERR